MASDWKQKYEQLLETQQKLMSELSLAAKVQQSLLPDLTSLQLPEEIEIGIISVAARQVSGDFYNVIPYKDGLLVSVADISGKSVPAAIMTSMIRFGMDTVIDLHQPPHISLRQLNKFVDKASVLPMFISMFIGDYQASTHTFHYSSAGHEPALLYHAEGRSFDSLSTDGMVLGLSVRHQYETKQIKMKPGDFILMYTDGVIEERNSATADSDDKLRHHLADMKLDTDAQSIVDELHRRIMLEQPAVQDDQTMMLFRRKS